ncbi:MAG: hypothetical protein H7287_11075 [Thermoleophilia bacterium]|nr:hypothetical protein [Thermoleophilia bacterium]
MKIWAHVIATVVGLAVAGLIVFLVFGSASREGALQDGTAGAGRTTEDGTLCGTVAVADVNSSTARQAALKNAPPVFNKLDQQIEFPKANGKAWLARVQASSGLCIDEIRYGEPGDTTSISMSTVKRITPEEASAYTGATFVAAGLKPLDGRNVSIVTFVGDQKRSIYFSRRAYAAYTSQRRGLGLGTTVTDLIKFRRLTNFKGDIRINGWS